MMGFRVLALVAVVSLSMSFLAFGAKDNKPGLLQESSNGRAGRSVVEHMAMDDALESEIMGDEEQFEHYLQEDIKAHTVSVPQANLQVYMKAAIAIGAVALTVLFGLGTYRARQEMQSLKTQRLYKLVGVLGIGLVLGVAISTTLYKMGDENAGIIPASLQSTSSSTATNQQKDLSQRLTAEQQTKDESEKLAQAVQPTQQKDLSQSLKAPVKVDEAQAAATVPVKVDEAQAAATVEETTTAAEETTTAAEKITKPAAKDESEKLNQAPETVATIVKTTEATKTAERTKVKTKAELAKRTKVTTKAELAKQGADDVLADQSTAALRRLSEIKKEVTETKGRLNPVQVEPLEVPSVDENALVQAETDLETKTNIYRAKIDQYNQEHPNNKQELNALADAIVKDAVGKGDKKEVDARLNAKSQYYEAKERIESELENLGNELETNKVASAADQMRAIVVFVNSNEHISVELLEESAKKLEAAKIAEDIKRSEIRKDGIKREIDNLSEDIFAVQKDNPAGMPPIEFIKACPTPTTGEEGQDDAVVAEKELDPNHVVTWKTLWETAAEGEKSELKNLLTQQARLETEIKQLTEKYHDPATPNLNKAEGSDKEAVQRLAEKTFNVLIQGGVISKLTELQDKNKAVKTEGKKLKQSLEQILTRKIEDKRLNDIPKDIVSRIKQAADSRKRLYAEKANEKSTKIDIESTEKFNEKFINAKRRNLESKETLKQLETMAKKVDAAATTMKKKAEGVIRAMEYTRRQRKQHLSEVQGNAVAKKQLESIRDKFENVAAEMEGLPRLAKKFSDRQTPIDLKKLAENLLDSKESQLPEMQNLLKTYEKKGDAETTVEKTRKEVEELKNKLTTQQAAEKTAQEALTEATKRMLENEDVKKVKVRLEEAQANLKTQWPNYETEETGIATKKQTARLQVISKEMKNRYEAATDRVKTLTEDGATPEEKDKAKADLVSFCKLDQLFDENNKNMNEATEALLDAELEAPQVIKDTFEAEMANFKHLLEVNKELLTKEVQISETKMNAEKEKLALLIDVQEAEAAWNEHLKDEKAKLAQAVKAVAATTKEMDDTLTRQKKENTDLVNLTRNLESIRKKLGKTELQQFAEKCVKMSDTEKKFSKLMEGYKNLKAGEGSLEMLENALKEADTMKKEWETFLNSMKSNKSVSKPNLETMAQGQTSVFQYLAADLKNTRDRVHKGQQESMKRLKDLQNLVDSGRSSAEDEAKKALELTLHKEASETKDAEQLQEYIDELKNYIKQCNDPTTSIEALSQLTKEVDEKAKIVKKTTRELKAEKPISSLIQSIQKEQKELIPKIHEAATRSDGFRAFLNVEEVKDIDPEIIEKAVEKFELEDQKISQGTKADAKHALLNMIQATGESGQLVPKMTAAQLRAQVNKLTDNLTPALVTKLEAHQKDKDDQYGKGIKLLEQYRHLTLQKESLETAGAAAA